METLTTAPAGTAIHGGFYVIPDAIGGKQFHPYSDFLLHNIGTGDGIVQNGPADTQYKVRTMPLWGLRTRTQMLHNGSGSTYSDAVLHHRGEAAAGTAKFNRLTAAQRSTALRIPWFVVNAKAESAPPGDCWAGAPHYALRSRSSVLNRFRQVPRFSRFADPSKSAIVRATFRMRS